MLELPNFDYITTSTILFESLDKVLLDRNYDAITFMSKYLYFKKA